MPGDSGKGAIEIKGESFHLKKRYRERGRERKRRKQGSFHLTHTPGYLLRNRMNDCYFHLNFSRCSMSHYNCVERYRKRTFIRLEIHLTTSAFILTMEGNGIYSKGLSFASNSHKLRKQVFFWVLGKLTRPGQREREREREKRLSWLKMKCIFVFRE